MCICVYLFSPTAVTESVCLLALLPTSAAILSILKEYSSSPTVDIHNGDSHETDKKKERSKLILQRPRYPDFQSIVLVKLQKS